MASRSPVQKLKLVYYFDVVSPYACLGFFVLKRYITHWNLDLVLKPAFLGGIMKLAENQPPGMHPLRGAYLENDLRRNKHYFNLPEMCDGIPSNFISSVARKSLQVQRFLCYSFVKIDHEYNNGNVLGKNAVDKKLSLLQSFYEGVHFEKSERLMNENRVHINDDWIKRRALKSGVLDEKLILSALAASKDDKIVKKQVEANTVEAVDFGAFGLPVMLVGDKQEFFFGSDRFGQLASMFNLPWYGPDPNKSKL